MDRTRLAGSEDVKRLFRNIDDHTAASILALRPTLAQLEEAATRAAGAGDVFGGIRPAEGVVSEILELVSSEEEGYED
ncbi:MAG TPA: hypothetical protein VE986_04720 [Hyphomicrobiales bacterium]|nr:hypothetical protein [Hyphomicrobiales bacterium]